MSDYSKLVEALRYCVSGVCKNCSYFDKCKENGTAMAQLHNDAAAAIEALQAEIRESMQKCAECSAWNQPHWVSVEERLPEIGQLILLNFEGCFSIAVRTEDEMFEGKRYWKLEDDYWERIEDDYYWMPIEPPQEVQDDK